ncbi:MAG: hypothetical protein AMXMBFR84_11300 [Candidatus Hydrogenedentota bacterium]
MKKYIAAIIVLAVSSLGAHAEFSVATFNVDITAPMGHALMGGGIAPADQVIDSLFAKGCVLLGAEKPIVFLALDWCEVRNDAYDRWRSEISAAAGTQPDHVLMSCIHQHDTPIADLEAQRLLDEHGLKGALVFTDYHEDCVQRVASAVREALPNAVPITHYGYGEGETHELASNRRVEMPDGVNYNRTSATADAAMRDRPAGDNDPMVKSISFWNGDTPVVAMYAFSIHPMSYYGRGDVSADFVGMARTRMHAEHPETFQIYFSGCSGDTIAGKWNDGNPKNRQVLADKLYAGMNTALESTAREPLDAVRVNVAKIMIPARDTGDYAPEVLKSTLADPSRKTFDRILAAMGLSWQSRVASGQPVDFPAVDFGKAIYLLMPAESFVGWQLRAQAIRPDRLVFVAGYGECAPGYIPTPRAIEEGFIQAHDWCWVNPDVAEIMETALAEALK